MKKAREGLSDPSNPEAGRRSRCWWLLGGLWLCSCATANTLPEPPVSELLCDRNADCEIVDGPLHSCNHGVQYEPYAISRLALTPDTTPLLCTENLYESTSCHTNLADWIAVCSNHICKRRRAHFFSWPKVHCPNR